jgi:hypothetical protein
LDATTVTVVLTIVDTFKNLIIIWVWVVDTVHACTHHKTTALVPQLRESSHAVISAVVNAADLRVHASAFLVG